LISENLLELEDDYRLENLISNSIHSNSELLLNEHEHELYMDDELINDYDSFKNIINGDYSIELFEANSKIHFKLKVNLREYFILENFAFPTLAVLVPNNRALRSENLHHSRGVAPSDFRPLRKIPYCCLP